MNLTKLAKSLQFAKMQGGGSGGGGTSGGGLIEVDALPTANIDKNAVYLLKATGKKTNFEIYLTLDGTLMPFSQMAAYEGLAVYFYDVVDTFPDNPQLSLETGTYHVYIKDDIPYIFADMGEGVVRVTLGDLVELENKGYISDISQISEAGVYVTYEINLQDATATSLEKDFVYARGEWIPTSKLLSLNYIFTIKEVTAEDLADITQIRDNMFSCQQIRGLPQANLLEKITIPVHIESIGNGAFQQCGNLHTIVYEGTKEQWKAIQKAGTNPGAAETPWDWATNDYTIYCTDGTIAKDGTET